MNRGLNTGMTLLVAAATLIACSGQTPGQVSATVTLADTPTRQPDPTVPPAATAAMQRISPTATQTPVGTATASVSLTDIPTTAATPTDIPPCFVSDPAPIAFMPDGARILVQAEAGVQIFNLQTMRAEAFLRAPARLAWAATALPPDGTTVAWALEDHTIQFVRIAGGQVVHTLRGHTDVVGKLRFSPSGDRLFLASHDTWVRVWDMAGKQVGAFQPSKSTPRPPIHFKRSANVEQTARYRQAEVPYATRIVSQAGPHCSMPPVAFIVRVSSDTGRRLHSEPSFSANREFRNSTAVSQRARFAHRHDRGRVCQ